MSEGKYRKLEIPELESGTKNHFLKKTE